MAASTPGRSAMIRSVARVHGPIVDRGVERLQPAGHVGPFGGIEVDALAPGDPGIVALAVDGDAVRRAVVAHPEPSAHGLGIDRAGGASLGVGDRSGIERVDGVDVQLADPRQQGAARPHRGATPPPEHERDRAGLDPAQGRVVEEHRCSLARDQRATASNQAVRSVTIASNEGAANSTGWYTSMSYSVRAISSGSQARISAWRNSWISP